MDYFNDIQRIICNGEKIPLSEAYILKKKTRKREIVFPRQLIMYFLRLINGESVSWQKIADYFGQDHATAMHAFDAITDLLETNRIAAARIMLYELQIRAVVDFEKNLIIDNFETTKARLKQMIDDNVPITWELITIYNALLEKSQKPA